MYFFKNREKAESVNNVCFFKFQNHFYNHDNWIFDNGCL